MRDAAEGDSLVVFPFKIRFGVVLARGRQ